MSTKHTPGPWEVAYLDRNGQAVVKSEHTEIATCWHHCVRSLEEEMHANAQLIAAAPKLLDMLKRVTEAEFGLGAWPTEEELRAAIAEAEGARHLPECGKCTDDCLYTHCSRCGAEYTSQHAVPDCAEFGGRFECECGKPCADGCPVSGSRS